ncbi:MAG: PEP/pyruvate-binding domain-containing protein [Anaerohalosphaeraceae bacterium]|nr:PEP/pyruvate-binding domain-containing protein [Anaerohalosphaeraceae bacterium]
MIQNEKLSTGLSGFDDVIKQVLPGDNIIWQVDSVEDFLPLVKPYCENAIASGWELVYFRFAKHAPFVTAAEGANVIELDPQQGFETFTTKVHSVINQFGQGHYYLFDCLSELASSWRNDRMLGNFFMQVCPYLYYAQTVTAFALLRNYHSFHATRPILDTAQVISNVYRYDGNTYVQPIKVDGRYSPTMNMIHLWDGDDFTPVCDSGTITEILSSVGGIELDAASERPGFWARTFQEAEKISEDYKQGLCKKEKVDEMFNRLVRMIISRDEKMLRLAIQYLALDDVIRIRKRMIGTGLIGGKSVGMLLARAILEKTDSGLKNLLEPHDSFFIGSDVFYTYLVKNKIWWLRQKQRNNINFLDGASEGRQRIMQGEFPDYIQKQFSDVLDYYGQSPIIVRSSSILEDNYGNAFAGKYESYFCANQGTRQQRLNEFVTAIKKIYASSMGEDALVYRSKWGLLEKDEPMGLLVQRVSGAPHGNCFFPQAAGVALSFNPYVWTEDIDPKAGMLRLVFGMGTRAVDRNDDDYARIVSLSDPSKRPESNIDEARKYTQQKVDAVDLAAGKFVTKSFVDIAKDSDSNLRLDLFASRDREMEKRAARLGRKEIFSWAITFEKLLSKTDFPQRMRWILEIVQKIYDSPVDVEFALNFVNDSEYKINILQCRPLELRGGGEIDEKSMEVSQKHRIIDVTGPVIGQSRQLEIDQIIYVSPDEYHKLKIGDRYELARIIGRLTHVSDRDEKRTMLIGPGRWGTSTPSLGVPVSYPEINTISVLAEIAIFNKEISAEVSLGTHFFSDLIENDTLYLGILPNRDNNICRNNFFENSPNELAKILPDFKLWSKVIRVIDSANLQSGHQLHLHANAIDQNFMLYLK